MNKYYITTAIDYVNDTIHIGHAFQKIAADVLARYYRIYLGNDNVFFLTGTDEYGQKAEKAAKKQGITPLKFVREIALSDRKQQDSLNISYNRFIETSDVDHAEVAKEVWKKVDLNGDIYPAEYTGLYCEGCEAYYEKTDLVKGKCPFHPTAEVKQVTEKNYFFKWSKYKEFLIDHIKKNPDFIFPKERIKEMLEFAKDIRDIPISRTNFTWGVPVPGDDKQVMYVWFDALTNYLTGVGFLRNKNLFDKFWPADVHVLGKDNLRWHALLWPAMLKSAGIQLPKTILVNGFLNLNGQKISKSLGNIIRPRDWVGKYGADAVRYYLLRYAVITEDSDISEEKLKQAYNSDLANGLGNLVSRVAKLCEKKNVQGHPVKKTEAGRENKFIFWLVELGLEAKYVKALENYKFNEALSLIWEEITKLDRKINEEKPWEEKEDIDDFLEHTAVYSLLDISSLLRPFLPETAKKIEEQFKGPKITSLSPLFPRI